MKKKIKTTNHQTIVLASLLITESIIDTTLGEELKYEFDQSLDVSYHFQGRTEDGKCLGLHDECNQQIKSKVYLHISFGTLDS